MKFGEYLRGLREAKGLSVRQLADQIGLESSYVSKIEHGERLPKEEVMEDLAGVLGVNPHLLAAMAGRVSKGLLEAIQKNPERFGALFAELEHATPKILDRATRAVRDGDW